MEQNLRQNEEETPKIATATIIGQKTTGFAVTQSISRASEEL
jgi:hypothetical protein